MLSDGKKEKTKKENEDKTTQKNLFFMPSGGIRTVAPVGLQFSLLVEVIISNHHNKS